MKLIVQSEFVPLSGAGVGELPRLVIHRRTRVARNKAMVVLVHGLNGDRYGTWRNLPHFLYTDFGRVDLGLYAYPTALKRLRFWRSIELGVEAELLANSLRELVEYEHIILIGHSMGGLVARGAAAHYALTNQRKPQKRLAGIVTVASPILGSRRVPLIASLLSKDLRALAPHGAYLEQTAQALANHYRIGAELDTGHRRNLPQWAVRASDDYWVDRMSSTAGFPSEQVLTAAGSHTEVAKPETREEEVYRFISDAIESCCSARRGESVLEEPLIMVRTASAGDLDAIQAMSDEEFDPDDQSSHEQALAWLGVCPDIYWLFWEEKEDSEGGKGKLLGYFGLLPLREEAVRGLKAGSLTVKGILPEHLAADPDDLAAMYVGGLIGKGLAAKSLVISQLRTVLLSHAIDRPLEVLTRPVTPDGLRLAKRRGFTPVHPGRSGLEEMYHSRMQRE